MMNKSDVIINGKSIANLNGRIARHAMIFKSGIKDLSSYITNRAITCVCMQLQVNKRVPSIKTVQDSPQPKIWSPSEFIIHCFETEPYETEDMEMIYQKK